MKALSLHQPWASLVALGVKSIETRSWPAKYRGPLLVHAGKRQPETMRLGNWWCEPTWGAVYGLLNEAGEPHRLPLGAVVASATLTDCVPILAAGEDPCPGGDEWVKRVAPLSDHGRAQDGELRVWSYPSETENESLGRPTWVLTDIEDQRPFGDFSPGRWAWLLDDVKPIFPPVPMRGRQGLWNCNLEARAFADGPTVEQDC